MDRYWQANTGGNPPTPPGSNGGGYPKNGNPASGVKGTVPGEWWYHLITEELRAAIVALGGSPDYTQTDQLAQALLSALATLAVSIQYDDLIGAPTLATVATSGQYADLQGLPVIPPAQVNADWNATSGVAQILNRPGVGTAPGDLVQLDGNGDLPAVDGSQLVNVAGNATALQGVALSATAPADSYLLRARDTGGGVMLWEAVPPGLAAPVASGQVRYLRTETETISGATYYDISDVPMDATGPYVEAVNAGTAPNTDNLISQHVGPAWGVAHTIEAGTWTAALWTQTSSTTGGGTTLKLAISRLDTDSGAITPVVAVSYVVSTTVMSQDSYAFAMPRIDVAATERIVLQCYCNATTNNRTITLRFGGAGYQSQLVIPDVLAHDELSGIKGNGTWHLSLAERDKLNGLATVASTGDYNDLINQPAIGAAQVNADWNATSGVAEILNKPTIPAAQVNADWNAASGVAQILNQPTLATVATTGNYADLSNKPAIPSPQVNADWNAASGVAMILNKPVMGASTDVQVFTAPGTWNKPAGAKAVHFRLIGAGGGAASGYVQSAAGGSAGGGGAGGGGAVTECLFDANLVGGACAIGVGLGGAGGVGDGGVPGKDGGDTYVTVSASPSLQLYAQGGRKGSGYTGGNGGFFGAAAGYAGLAGGGQGGSGSSSGATGTYGNVFYNGVSGTSWGGATGGGGGGGLYNGTANAGGGSWCGAGVNGGNSGGAANGAAPATPAGNCAYIGFGGPGGGGNATGNGAAGANGSDAGGGGGGGGAAALGFSAGPGGSGGRGKVIVTTFF